MKNFRILPLLIFVAMLSFSVRLVEVMSGVFVLAGPAALAEAPKAEASDKDKDKGASSLSIVDEEAHQVDEGQGKPVEIPDETFPEWRDPADDDPGYEASRMEVLKDLSKRHEELNQKEKSITTREALLKAAERELDQKYKELSQLRSELENLLQTQSEEEQKRIQSLVKIYEGMKPKDAARIFDTLDLDVLVGVVSYMSERKLSPVLAAMNPERARTITIMLAEQKQLPSLP